MYSVYVKYGDTWEVGITSHLTMIRVSPGGITSIPRRSTQRAELARIADRLSCESSATYVIRRTRVRCK